MTEIDLVGVPFDGWGRAGHQGRAAEVLQAAGLAEAFGARHPVRQPGAVLQLPAPSPQRGPAGGLLNEGALLVMIGQLGEVLRESLAAGRFPVVYGAECSVLLGVLPALRDHLGAAGLVFVDGHEDSTPLDVSPDGEAANVEIGLLLGFTGQTAGPALRRGLPALHREALAMLGMRDHELRRSLGLASLAERGVHLRRWQEVAADPAAAARAAVRHVRATTPGWWLHVDLDVIAQQLFRAQRVPGDEDEEGGLTWPQLTELLTAAVAEPGCSGLSLVIYDPDQDPGGDDARRIVTLAGEIAVALQQARA